MSSAAVVIGALRVNMFGTKICVSVVCGDGQGPVSTFYIFHSTIHWEHTLADT